MAEKFTFYEDYGVEEYYVYDPQSNHLLGYLRRGESLKRIRPIHGFVSPRLGIRFDLSGPELVVYHPNGRPFLTFEELEAERERTEQRAVGAEQRAEQEMRRAEQEMRRAEQEMRRAEQEMRRAEQAEQKAARLAVLTRKALRQEATVEELAELNRLVQAEPPA